MEILRHAVVLVHLGERALRKEEEERGVSLARAPVEVQDSSAGPSELALDLTIEIRESD